MIPTVIGRQLYDCKIGNTPTPEVFGTLFSDSFSNFNRWSPNGTIVVGGGQISNGASTGLNYIYDNYSAFGGDKFKCVATITVTTIGTGFGVGISNEHMDITDSSRKRSIWCSVNTTTGVLAISRRVSSANTVLRTATVTAPLAGHVVRVTFTRFNQTYQFIYENLTTGLTYPLQAIEVSTQGNSIGNFTIINFGGTYTPTLYTATTDCLKNCKVLTIGDSITHGFNITNVLLRWSNLLVAASEDSLEVWASNGAQTANAVASLPYLALLAPRNVILMIGGNDTEDVNVTVQELHDNYELIRNTLTAAGVNVIHCLPTPRQAEVPLTNFKNWIQSGANVGSDLKVDTWTPLVTGGNLLNPIYDSGDGRHPNDAGDVVMANTVLSTATSLITASSMSAFFLQRLQFCNGVSSVEKTLLAAFFDGINGQGYAASIFLVQLYGLTVKAGIDFRGVANAIPVNGPVYDRGGVLTNGINNFVEIGGYINSTFGFANSNIAVHIFIKDMVTAAGATVPFGCSDGTRLLNITQNVGTGISYRINQASGSQPTYTGKSVLDDGKVITISRSGTNALALYEDGVQLNTATNGATGLVQTILPHLGSFANSGLAGSFCSAKFGGLCFSIDLGGSLVDFVTRFKTVCNGIAVQ